MGYTYPTRVVTWAGVRPIIVYHELLMEGLWEHMQDRAYMCALTSEGV